MGQAQGQAQGQGCCLECGREAEPLRNGHRPSLCLRCTSLYRTGYDSGWGDAETGLGRWDEGSE